MPMINLKISLKTPKNTSIIISFQNCSTIIPILLKSNNNNNNNNNSRLKNYFNNNNNIKILCLMKIILRIIKNFLKIMKKELVIIMSQ